MKTSTIKVNSLHKLPYYPRYWILTCLPIGLLFLLLAVAGHTLRAQAIIAGGASNSFGVNNQGKIYTWGCYQPSLFGLMCLDSRSSPQDISSLGALAGKTIISVSAGITTSLALASDGSVYAWGWNDTGQLGNGTTTETYIPPAKVSLPAGVIIKQMVAGFHHSLAVASDGSVYAWGWNLNGQLGDGTTTNRNTPAKVSLSSGVTIQQVAAGHQHTVAVASDGSVYAWGYNSNGQIGDGTTTQRTIPAKVSLPSGVTIQQVAAGQHHSLAVASDGSVYVWGYNNFGQVGEGTNTNSSIPVKVSLPSGVTIQQVAAGMESSYALASDGSVYAWGLNNNGQLGNGTTTNSSIPVKVSLPSGVTIAEVAAGLRHVLAVASDGSVYTWGLNNNGQVGNGTTTNSSTPVKIPNFNLGEQIPDTDTEPPVFSNIPADATVECDAVPDPPTVTATDNEDGVILANLEEIRTNSACLYAYTLTRTWTATDAAGNTATATQTITVQDNTSPVLSGVPTSAIEVNTLASDAVTCGVAVTFPTITATDNCSNATITYKVGETPVSSGDVFNVGTTTVTVTATDDCGNASSATFDVKVTDAEAPVVPTPPADLSLQCASEVPAAIDLTATDNCDGNITVSPATVVTSGASANDFTEVRTWTFTDAAGNVSSVSQTIVVNDTQAPVITVPANITVNNDAGQCGAVVNFNVDATDNCDGALPPVLSHTSGSTFPVGMTTVTVNATDAAGNQATEQSFTVTVNDTEVPTVLAQNITVQLDASGNASITATDIDNGSTDNCEIASLLLSQTSFDCSHVGPNEVILTVTDLHGNSHTATATVTVEDPVAPTALAQDLTVQLDASGNAGITAGQIDNGSNDACGIVSLALDKTSFTCADVGENTVALTITDVNGNSAATTATVTVEDNVVPVAVAQDLTVALDANGNASITAGQIDNGSSDACGIASLGLDVTTFSCANVGANTVKLTVMDNNGNSATATATVTIEDNIAPDITAPADIIVSHDAGLCEATVILGNPITDDNCGVASVTNDAPLTFSVGTTIVTWTVEDVNGNLNTATQIVEVTNTAPVINNVSAPLNPVMEGDAVNVSAVFTDDNLTSATWYWGDGSSSAGTINGNGITGSHNYGLQDLYTLMLEVTDACGKTATYTLEDQFIVIYNPTGGFVTGGGWIYSPVGAYVDDPFAEGTATFGFVSKYKNGTTVPSGNTAFEFKAVGMEFKSTSYEWLVVAGPQAKYKGEGTINGGGSYGFMLSAVDGELKGDGIDRFHIKIWDKLAGDAVVYDNEMNTSEDAEASTAIAQGSIVIHTSKDKNARQETTVAKTPDISSDLSGTGDDLSRAFFWNVYPNPVQEEVFIDVESEVAEEATLQVYDLMGHLLMEQKKNLQVGSNQIHLTAIEQWAQNVHQMVLYFQSPSIGVKQVKLLKP